MSEITYCLDANVLIQAWQKYYSPRLCPDYWTMLNALGSEGRVFIPSHVAEEIQRTEDDLRSWLTASEVAVHPVDGEITQAVSRIFGANPLHQHLVDNIRGRSLADPWVIAHAMVRNATVVTKEERVLQPNTTRIRIPNVCENMGVSYTNDFGMLEALGVRFSCGR